MFRRATAAARGMTAGNAFARLAGRTADAVVLHAHRLAVRLDRVPQEFGQLHPVDETDSAALRREWVRQMKLWAAYNPEELFALKVGVGVFAGAVAILLLLVSAF